MTANLPGGPATAARRAEQLAARLPPLLVAAERVAATVAQGVHGRRRVGQGDSFWQFRQFLAGDSVHRIDWRQSAKGDRTFVRETEWEAAQSVWLWRDASAGMRWRSDRRLPEKAERAELLTLALASLLLRGGERVALLGAGMRPVSGRSMIELLSEAMSRRGDPGALSGLPPAANLPRYGRVVLIGDFLSPLPDVQQAVARLAQIPVSGHLLQVLDPAEAALPFRGRIRFEGLKREGAALIGKVEGIRGDYQAKLAAQQEGLRAIAAAAGWSFAVHITDHSPETALMGLYLALAPDRAGLGRAA
ncbi:DUF58 domain-containing protein [Elioraea sp.]|uniref:DUF58 domain-containing protein n=1 Tax=Elioraea sp. TaxID=2185103 RepID=UPI003F709894